MDWLSVPADYEGVVWIVSGLLGWCLLIGIVTLERCWRLAIQLKQFWCELAEVRRGLDRLEQRVRHNQAAERAFPDGEDTPRSCTAAAEVKADAVRMSPVPDMSWEQFPDEVVYSRTQSESLRETVAEFTHLLYTQSSAQVLAKFSAMWDELADAAAEADDSELLFGLATQCGAGLHHTYNVLDIPVLVDALAVRCEREVQESSEAWLAMLFAADAVRYWAGRPGLSGDARPPAEATSQEALKEPLQEAAEGEPIE